jgi:hypothetical protein
MEHLRYLLTAVLAITLIMSVVSSMNQSYFAGLNAFADDDNDDDNSGSLSSNHGDYEQSDHENNSLKGSSDDNNGKAKQEDNEYELVQSLGNHSMATLKPDEEARLRIEIKGGDLADGTYNITFACDSPNFSKDFHATLIIEDGRGNFEEELALSNVTYTGCEVDVDNLSLTFPPFTNMANKDDDNGSSKGSNDHDQKDHNNSGRGSNGEGSSNGQRNDRKHRIVNSTSGAEIHKGHQKANSASPGEYKPSWNYTLQANGTAMNEIQGENLMHNVSASVDVDMSVWKSNNAMILLDVINGTVEAGNQTYTIKVGYALYSLNHDTIKIAALAMDGDSNVLRLRMQGTAVNEDDKFPIESKSIDLTFVANSPLQNRFGDWQLTLDGIVSED